MDQAYITLLRQRRRWTNTIINILTASVDKIIDRPTKSESTSSCSSYRVSGEFLARIASTNARCGRLRLISMRCVVCVRACACVCVRGVHDRKTDELIEMPSRVSSWEPWCTYGHHLANTMELSVLCGDAGCAPPFLQPAPCFALSAVHKRPVFELLTRSCLVGVWYVNMVC